MTEAAERYARATHSSNLAPNPLRLTDADTLTAAGIAASKDPRKALALTVYRCGVTGDRAGVAAISESLAGWLNAHLSRGGRKPMQRIQRVDLARQVLTFWFDQGCKVCDGLCYKKVPGTPALSANECPQCHGTGKRPIASVIHPAELEAGRWLAAELDSLVASIHADMARLLSERIAL